MKNAPLIKVKEGQLQGRVNASPSGRDFYSFQGIPYAKPPVGSLRFKAPQPVEPWNGIRDATTEGNVCPQIDPVFYKSYAGDEDCLYLNVYTPNLSGASLPVMVYIHGGSFKLGSGSSSIYGADYLIEKDVVVVTMNYRVEALGFLCLNTPEVPGNAGLKDIVQAIRWVKDNIHNFGGDSGNLTLFGESAGGAATSLLTASPLTKTLISKAIIQSGTALCNFSFQKTPINNAKQLAKSLGKDTEDVDEILEFLTGISAKEIIEASEKMNPFETLLKGESGILTPVIEKEFPGVESVISESFYELLISGRVADVPIMIGTTSLELTIEWKTDDLQEFIPDDLQIEKNSEEAVKIAEQIKRLYFKGNLSGPESSMDYYKLMSDKFMNIATHRYVKYLFQVSKKPIYYYKFDYVGELNFSRMLTEPKPNHAAHFDENGYLFSMDALKDVKPTAQDEKMRERMLRLWTNFAKCGNPTPEQNHYISVTWLPVAKDNLYYLNLGNELTLRSNPDQEKMEFWDEVYSKHFKIWDHPKLNTEEVVRKHKPATVDHVETSSVKAANQRTSNEIKMTHFSNGTHKIVRANDPPEDDLPKNIGVNKFVNFFELLGDKK